MCQLAGATMSKRTSTCDDAPSKSGVCRCLHYNVNGAPTDITYGDARHTIAGANYDARGRASERSAAADPSRTMGAQRTRADSPLPPLAFPLFLSVTSGGTNKPQVPWVGHVEMSAQPRLHVQQAAFGP